MFIQSESIYLRALEGTDLDFLYELENDRQIWPVSDTRTPFSRHVLQEYLQRSSADIYEVRQLRFVICQHDHQPVGTVDLYDFDPAHLRAGVGLVLAPSFQGRGYGFQALTCLEEYSAATLHLHQLFCSVAHDNEKSIRLFSKAGFRQVGVRKDWLRMSNGWKDVVELQKILP
ncbi:GNAT family N-acetyltransferase [soil metagenome]|jgi:diamine N-acetyltransferase